MFRLIRCSVAKIAVPNRFFGSKPDLSKYGNVYGGENIDPKALETFKVWHEVVASAKTTGPTEQHKQLLEKQVHQNCTFHPPTYYKHWEGKEKFLLIIGAVVEVFGSSFTYGRQWLSPDGKEWALEFITTIGDSKMSMTGIDLVTLDDNGQIIDFKVLARPPNAVAELKSRMMAKVGMKLVKNSISSLFK